MRFKLLYVSTCLIAAAFSLTASAVTLTAGTASGTCGDVNVVVPISIDTAAGMQSLQFELTYDPTRIIATSARATTLTTGWTVTANTASATNKITVAAAGNAPIASGSGSVIEVLFRVVSTAPNKSTSALHLQNIVINETAGTAGPDATFTIACATSGVSGDANGDGAVTVGDVFYLINNLFAGGAAPVGNADANGDGAVTVGDVFYLINFLFAGGPAPK